MLYKSYRVKQEIKSKGGGDGVKLLEMIPLIAIVSMLIANPLVASCTVREIFRTGKAKKTGIGVALYCLAWVVLLVVAIAQGIQDS